MYKKSQNLFKNLFRVFIDSKGIFSSFFSRLLSLMMNEQGFCCGNMKSSDFLNEDDGLESSRQVIQLKNNILYLITEIS